MNKYLISAVALASALALPGLSLAQDASASASAQTQTSTQTGAGATTGATSASANTTTSASADTTTSATTSTDVSASASGGGTSTSAGIQTNLSVNITSQQTTEIKQVIVQANVAPVTVDFDISLGVVVPKTVKLVALPARIIEIVPQFKGYLFFVLADGRIIIVAPDTLKIVAILVV